MVSAANTLICQPPWLAQRGRHFALSLITVHRIVSRSHADRANGERGGLRRLDLQVHDLRRSAAFYFRTFGFRPSAKECDFVDGMAVLTVSSDADLVLHEQRSNASLSSPRCWAFVVTNLDYVRECVWNLGVKVARDNGEPDQIHWRADGRSLYVCDPDDNEIELIELKVQAHPQVDVGPRLGVTLGELEVFVQ